MTKSTLPATSPQRLLSLDVLRGITIAFMVMVNNNGGEGSWSFMDHAPWNGLTATDLVFPAFVFVVGISIVFAFEARQARGVTNAELAWHTVRRAGILFLLGIVVNGFPFFELAHLRIYGVLQRTAVCYLIVALFYLWDKRVLTKVAALLLALVGYWILMRWVPVPGAGMPGRDVPFLDPNLNLVSWLDRLIMPGHLYEDSTHNLRDPEGLLSNIPAVGTALMGLLTGLWLRGRKPVKAKTLGLVVATVVCLASGYLWSIRFPLNKKLWTSSFVLVTAGWSLAGLTLAYWAIEQRGWFKRKGKEWILPWLVFGSNAIVAYMISVVLARTLRLISFTSEGQRTNVIAYAQAHVFAHIPDPGWGAFAYSVTFLAVIFVPVWVLYHKKIFVKI